MFSKSCEYGLRSILFIAEQSLQEKMVGLKQIAKAIDSPEAFTAKILQTLTKSGVVGSVKGPYGGFYLEELSIKNTTIKQIVTLFDGDKIYTGCALGLKQCNEEKPCPLHNQFKGIRADLNILLEENTIMSLLAKSNAETKLWLKV
jgi:Rrf2 family protein